jgi:hypothetical protein
MFKKLLLSCIAVPIFYCAFAQEKDSPAFKQGDITHKDSSQKAIPKKTGDIKPYKEVIPDAAYTRSGLLTIHKVEDNWFFEIPDTLFNRDILVVTRVEEVPGGGSIYGGELVNQQMVRWVKGPNKNVFLQLVLTINVADSTNAIYKAVEHSNVNPYIASFPIKAYGKNSIVIDVQNYLSGDNVAASFSNAARKRLLIGSMLPDRSFIQSVHTYPFNTEIKTVKTFSVTPVPPGMPSIPGGGGFAAANEAGVVTITFNNSFLLLPRVPMALRQADPRVGFYSDDYTQYSDNQQRVQDKQFIVRWRLEPRPEEVEKWKRGKLVEPQKPIVYYIDPATPAKWVPYLKAGIDDWSKAFEKAGFKNAILAKDWPVNDTTMSMEDARFSVLRYFASDIPNAYGPNVHDPRSGEILESHIGWYHNVMKLVHNWYMVQVAPNDPRARKMVFDDSLMGSLIRFISSHEIGHTLGLMHNFGSSSTVPVEMLRNKKWLKEHGHSPSIMDYARFNYVAQPEDHLAPDELYPHIGEYDRWAIQWGYSYSGGKTEEEDHKIMNTLIIDSLSKNPRLWFGSEKDSNDPRCQNEDLGDDAMKAGDYGILNLQRVIKSLPEWTKEPTDTYDNLREMYNQLTAQYMLYMNHVLKNIGGIYTTPKSVEQSGDVYEPVAITKQQEALAFMNRQFFKTPRWLLDSNIINKIHSPVDGSTVAYMQSSFMASLLDGDRLKRLATSADQFGVQCYQPNELLNDIEQYIFSEWSNKAPIEYYRRNIQKAYIDALIVDCKNKHVDVSLLAYGHLSQLKKQIGQITGSYQDIVSKYYLQMLDATISKVLNAGNNE